MNPRPLVLDQEPTTDAAPASSLRDYRNYIAKHKKDIRAARKMFWVLSLHPARPKSLKTSRRKLTKTTKSQQ